MDKLPLMPGTNELVHGDLWRSNYRRCHTLTGHNNGGEPKKANQEIDTFAMTNTISNTSLPPAHLALDRKVLKFKCYFREGVHESTTEAERVRLCVVYYFLEDDTIAVSEPRQLNSGMNQGTLVKRHKIKQGGRYLSFSDLRLSDNVTIYGKTFRIYDCDTFTREFCLNAGHDVGKNEQAPQDTYDTNARQRFESNKKRELCGTRTKLSLGQTAAAGGSSATKEEVKQTTQFLQNDKKVLKFKAMWDEVHNTGGERRYFNLYYFLSDDCIEVIEMVPANSGRDPFPSFVRRRKCPKNPNPSSITGTLTFQRAEQEYWKVKDLCIGTELVICGKRFKLYDCDTFTKEYLKEHCGRTASELQSVDVKVIKKEAPKPAPPPHNGFGDEEDSLRSWRQLALKCPVKDVRKFTESGNEMLKFSLELLGGEIDSMRKFVLTYYVSDDTISIFEAVARNSGILGGRFLQRQKVKLGNGEYATAASFYVGAVVEISHRKFRVTSTDERSLAYMEHNSKIFLKSNINMIMMKFKAMFISTPTGLKDTLNGALKQGQVDYTQLMHIVESLGLPLVEQEVLTMLRYFNTNGSLNSYEELLVTLSVSETDITDKQWQDIHEEWDSDVTLGKTLTEDEQYRLNDLHDSRAAQGMLKLLQEYNKRRALFQQELRIICDYSNDGCIGPGEFAVAVTKKLKVDIAPKQLDQLCSKLFPPVLRRVPYREMIRLIEDTTNYVHSTKTIARIRK